MTCKYCGKDMEFDSTEGVGYSECHNYVCGCGASCTVPENLAEPDWQEGETIED